jgi:D-aminoacyl-tRNA deacylase
MIIVLQRVDRASVIIDSRPVAEIGKGAVLLVCIEEADTEKEILYWAVRIPELRICPDESDKMNISLKDAQRELLVISQFTLVSNMRKGRRPGFEGAAHPDKAKKLLELFMHSLAQSGLVVKSGEFGAYMKIHLVNDGPVTFILNND